MDPKGRTRQGRIDTTTTRHSPREGGNVSNPDGIETEPFDAGGLSFAKSPTDIRDTLPRWFDHLVTGQEGNMDQRFVWGIDDRPVMMTELLDIIRNLKPDLTDPVWRQAARENLRTSVDHHVQYEPSEADINRYLERSRVWFVLKPDSYDPTARARVINDPPDV